MQSHRDGLIGKVPEPRGHPVWGTERAPPTVGPLVHAVKELARLRPHSAKDIQPKWREVIVADALAEILERAGLLLGLCVPRHAPPFRAALLTPPRR